MSPDGFGSLIEQRLGSQLKSVSAVTGGDTNRCYSVKLIDGTALFAKTNSSSAVLTSEAMSLKAVREEGAYWYPTVYALDHFSHGSLLLLSHHDLSTPDANASAELGRLLAQQHGIAHHQFGWHHDNHLGLTPQSNHWTPSWTDFIRSQRLIPQFDKAVSNQLDAKLIERTSQIIDQLETLLDTSNIQPRLLHGDLWSGNSAFDSGNQTAILFDPAPYFGDTEVDLAMARLFGGYHVDFFAAYHEIIPARAGWQQRAGIYNLVHALNHFNLFGSAYMALVKKCLDIDTLF